MPVGGRVGRGLDDVRLAVRPRQRPVAEEVPDALGDDLEDVERREGEAGREGVEVQRCVLGAEDLAPCDACSVGAHDNQSVTWGSKLY